MAVIAAEDTNDVDDALVLNNLDYARGHFDDPKGDFVKRVMARQPGWRSRPCGLIQPATARPGAAEHANVCNQAYP